MNEAFGTREDLPFDLKHKAGPISYRLESSARKSEIKAEKSKLVGELKLALREMLSAGMKAGRRPFPEAPSSDDNPGRYFQKGEVLARRNGKEYSSDSDTLVYLRLFPASQQPTLARAEAMEALMSSNLGALNDRAIGNSTEQNKYGVIAFVSYAEAEKILSATQVFKTRELWGFDTYMLSPELGKSGIPTGWHESMLASGLHKYVKFATEALRVEPPLVAEIGLTHVEGYLLFMDRHKYWDNWGPIHEKNIVFRRGLASVEPKELDAFLVGAFEAIFDAGGAKRPAHYNGFPGETPGTIPRGV